MVEKQTTTRRRSHFTMMAVAVGAACAFTACNRKADAPELQTTTAIQRNGEPVTLTGCLKRGLVAEDTFVLLVSQADGGVATGTYELMARPNLNLGGQVGQQVRVTGKLLAEEQIVSSGGATPERAAKGTSGTPVVETKTDVDVRRLEPTSVSPVGAPCQP
jgi:hypothetical protein